VVGVDSRAAGAIQHKARQGRAVVTQTQTGDAVHKQAGGGENHESSLTGACSGDGRRRLREREEEQSAAQKRASEQAGRQIDSETQQARVQRGEGRRAFKDSRRFADTHAQAVLAGFAVAMLRMLPRLPLGARVSRRSRRSWREREGVGQR
jgi:hypothetical protein